MLKLNSLEKNSLEILRLALLCLRASQTKIRTVNIQENELSMEINPFPAKGFPIDK